MNRKLLLLGLFLGLSTLSYAQGEFSFTATTGYNDNGTTRYSTGTYSIWSDVGINAQLDQLDRPIILVEGYDPQDDLNGLEIYDRFNNIQNNFLAIALRGLGYDIIIVDFDDDNDRHIQQNAMLLVDLIDEVNSQKIGNNQNVVIGVSMGGLIARYALAYMEDNQMPHDTRLFATFDTPHRGANISVASQMAISDFRNDPFLLGLTNGQPLLAAFELDKPAVKQMLAYHEPSFTFTSPALVPQANALFDDFFNDLRNLNGGVGYPTQCRKIAISNGVKTGLKQPKANGDPLNTTIALDLQFNDVFFATMFSWPDISTAVDPIDATTQASIYQRAHISGQTQKSIFLQGIQPLDNCPGGTTPLYSEIADGLADVSGIDVTLNAPNTSFIATVSALDLDVDPLTDLSSDLSVQCQTPFDAFYSPLLANQEHTTLPTETASWLFEQITADDWIITLADQNSYNFGQNTTDRVFRDVHILDNGLFTVNDDRRTDFFRRNLTIIDRPADSSYFDVYTAGCKTNNTITVDNNGQLTLGSTPDWMSGRLHILEGDNVVIQSGGLTRLRAESRLFTEDQATIRVEGGGELRVQDNARVVVDDGGTMIIENSADVVLEDNAWLLVKNGGELILNGFNQLTADDLSHIIIEEGGQLTYREDASIHLTNTSNTLKISGKLAIEDDAVFTYSGDGHLVFDQNLWKTDPNTGQVYQALDDFWDIGDNTEFHLEGGQVFSDVIMETRQPFVPQMNDGTTFSTMTIKRGKVLIGETAPLHCFGALDMANVEITSTNPNQYHDGFRIHYNPNPITITNVRFKHGKKSLIAHWYGSTNPLVLDAVTFQDNTIGFFSDRGNFQLNNCDFFNNTTGVNGNMITGTSTIANSVFNNNGTGFYAHGQSGTNVITTASDYIDNTDGMFLIDLDLTAKCANFSNNVNTGIFVIDAHLYLNDDASNQFYNNQNGIYLSGDGETTGLYLDEGNNEFNLGAPGATYAYNATPTKAYIRGIVHDAKPQSVYTGANEILADDNKMPFITLNPTTPQSGPASGLTYVMPVDIHYSTGSGPTISYTPVYISIPNNITSIESNCDNISPFADQLPALPIIQSITDAGDPLVGGKWNGMTVKEALLDAIDNITIDQDQKNDLLALDDLQEILLVRSSSTIDEEQRLITIAYNLMQMAFGNAYKYGQLINTENNATSVELAVDRSITIMEDIVNALDPASATYAGKLFATTLDQAQTYRMGGYYDEALSILANDAQWATGNDLQRTGFWACICNAEKDYVEDVIDTEGLLSAMASCNQSFMGYNYKRTNQGNPSFYQRYTEQGIQHDLNLFPQPALDHITLELNNPYTGQVAIKILDITGKLITSHDVDWIGQSHDCDVSNLPSGTYAVEVVLGKTTISKKLIIE